MQMSNDNATSAIFRLPDELLVKIFLYSVDDKNKPTPLTHVCRLWREVAQRTKGLWSIIDLVAVEEAKFHIQLARDAPLQVVWFDRHQGVTKPDNYGWIWGHASRFSHLDLVIPARIVTHVFACMGVNMPELLELTVMAHDLYFPSVLSPCMPKLRVLRFSSFQISAVYLISILRNSPLLEEAEFMKISLPVLAPTPPDPFLLPCLKTFTIVEMYSDSQDYILSRVLLPRQCKLVIMGYTERHNHRRLLHPSTVASLAPIRFTSVALHARSMEYDESSNDSRCSLTMKISKPLGQPVDDEMVIDPAESLDLSHVTTLHLYDARHGVDSERDVVFVLLSVVRSIRTLVFHSHAIPASNHVDNWLSRVLLDNCFQLATIILDEVSLTSSTSGSVAMVEVLAQFSARRVAQRLQPPRLLLRACNVDNEIVQRLQGACPVEVV